MGFVTEQINGLNNSLYRAFSDDIKERPRRSSLSDMNEAVRTGDKRKFLSLATEAIDLSGSSLPSPSTLARYLNMYHEFPKDSDDKELELLLVAKCTFALHGVIQETLLDSTLPLSQSIRYWSRIHGNWGRETYYAVQTTPIRIFRLASKTLREAPIGISALSNHISNLSRKDIIKQLFPYYSRIASTRHIIRSEVYHKRSKLVTFKNQQAARLGLLIQKRPQIDPQSDFDSAYKQVNANLNLLMHILNEIGNMNTDKSLCHDDHQMDKLLSYDFNDNKDMGSLIKALDDITLVMIPKCEEQYNRVIGIYGKPSLLTRYWAPLTVLYFGGNVAVKYVSRQQDNIKIWLNEAVDTAQDFAIHWLWEPMLKVWDTIRMKDQQLALLSKEGLRSDMESLERMVAEFGRDHYHFTEEQIAQLSSQVREGDLSSVLKAYEEAIKSPVKNALRGDLIRTLLIQVQKTKVDVDLAMAALDKLLKSNELNFAFLAVAPSMILMWAIGAWIKGTWEKRTGVQVGKLGAPMRESLREVERVLNQADTRNKDKSGNGLRLSCQQQGLVLCEVHLLRSYARRLPQRNCIREKFIEDLRELENPNYNLEQRFRTIQRMSRTWGFLTAPQRL